MYHSPHNIALIKNNVSEVKISYSTVVKPSERIKITSSSDAEVVFRHYFESLEHVESVLLIALNTRNTVLNCDTIASGGVSSCIIDNKVILQRCLLLNASSLIIAHNHPSGNLNPSNADTQITKKLKEAAEAIGMKLLDHLIITKEDKFSFADENLL